MPTKQSEQPTILRIRCKKRLFLDFKRIAVDYENYEEALEVIMISHLKQIQSTPLPNKTDATGSYR